MKRDFRDKRQDAWVEKRQRTDSGYQGGSSGPPESNGAFEAYYKIQGVCPEEVGAASMNWLHTRHTEQAGVGLGRGAAVAWIAAAARVPE